MKVFKFALFLMVLVGPIRSEEGSSFSEKVGIDEFGKPKEGSSLAATYEATRIEMNPTSLCLAFFNDKEYKRVKLSCARSILDNETAGWFTSQEVYDPNADDWDWGTENKPGLANNGRQWCLTFSGDSTTGQRRISNTCTRDYMLGEDAERPVAGGTLATFKDLWNKEKRHETYLVNGNVDMVSTHNRMCMVGKSAGQNTNGLQLYCSDQIAQGGDLYASDWSSNQFRFSNTSEYVMHNTGIVSMAASNKKICAIFNYALDDEIHLGCADTSTDLTVGNWRSTRKMSDATGHTSAWKVADRGAGIATNGKVWCATVKNYLEQVYLACTDGDPETSEWRIMEFDSNSNGAFPSTAFDAPSITTNGTKWCVSILDHKYGDGGVGHIHVGCIDAFDPSRPGPHNRWKFKEIENADVDRVYYGADIALGKSCIEAGRESELAKLCCPGLSWLPGPDGKKYCQQEGLILSESFDPGIDIYALGEDCVPPEDMPDKAQSELFLNAFEMVFSEASKGYHCIHKSAWQSDVDLNTLKVEEHVLQNQMVPADWVAYQGNLECAGGVNKDEISQEDFEKVIRVTSGQYNAMDLLAQAARERWVARSLARNKYLQTVRTIEADMANQTDDVAGGSQGLDFSQRTSEASRDYNAEMAQLNHEFALKLEEAFAKVVAEDYPCEYDNLLRCGARQLYEYNQGSETYYMYLDPPFPGRFAYEFAPASLQAQTKAELQKEKTVYSEPTASLSSALEDFWAPSFWDKYSTDTPKLGQAGLQFINMFSRRDASKGTLYPRWMMVKLAIESAIFASAAQDQLALKADQLAQCSGDIKDSMEGTAKAGVNVVVNTPAIPPPSSLPGAPNAPTRIKGNKAQGANGNLKGGANIAGTKVLNGDSPLKAGGNLGGGTASGNLRKMIAARKAGRESLIKKYSGNKKNKLAQAFSDLYQGFKKSVGGILGNGQAARVVAKRRAPQTVTQPPPNTEVVEIEDNPFAEFELPTDARDTYENPRTPDELVKLKKRKLSGGSRRSPASAVDPQTERILEEIFDKTTEDHVKQVKTDTIWTIINKAYLRNLDKFLRRKRKRAVAEPKLKK